VVQVLGLPNPASIAPSSQAEGAAGADSAPLDAPREEHKTDSARCLTTFVHEGRGNLHREHATTATVLLHKRRLSSTKVLLFNLLL
jgi:hypothetical protein